MIGRSVGLAAIALSVIATAAAQAPVNPVPVRLTSEVYRAANVVPDSMPGTLVLDCNLLGETSSLRVQNGQPGASVALMVSTGPGATHVPGVGTVLIAPNAVPVVGVFDPQGVFERPIELALPELANHTWYAQGVQVAPNGQVALSEGLELTFTPGNEQPALGYTGPAMTAIPCKAVDETIVTLYSVALEFEASSAYEAIDVIGVYDVGDNTAAIMVELTPAVTPRPPRVLREVVDLGPFPMPRIEVWVGTSNGVLEAEVGAGIDPPDATWTDTRRGDLFWPVRPHKAYGPRRAADATPFIICYGPAPDFLIPEQEGGCIVYARAALVDLRY